MRDNPNVSADPAVIAHQEALRLIDEQIGEMAYLSLCLASAERASKDPSPISFVEVHARLSNPLGPHPPRLEPDVGYYAFGSDHYSFPPLAGTIRLRDHGLDFLVAEGVSIRVAWRGSTEVGDGPDAGQLARLSLIGQASLDPDRQDDASRELQRFVARASSARAEILQATPTDFALENESAGPIRIWEVTVRVLPEGESRFEVKVEVPWRQVEEIEHKLKRGESLTGIPAEGEMLQVLFDRSDPLQAMARPTSGEKAPLPPPFPNWIVGRSLT